MGKRKKAALSLGLAGLFEQILSVADRTKPDARRPAECRDTLCDAGNGGMEMDQDPWIFHWGGWY